MADEDSKSKSEEKGTSSGGKLLQIVILVLLVAVLGLGGFIAWKLTHMPAPANAAKSKAEPKKATVKLPTILVPLEGITVNLADVGDSRYLHVKIKLAVAGKPAASTIKAHSPEIKDLIITTLSGKTFDDVRTSQGKFALKEELAYRINTLLGQRVVKQIYFTDFVAQ